jgi:peptide/nickel transport system substrate-binding protein
MILGAINENPFEYDPDKAKALLVQAGYAQGFAATLDHYSEEPFVDLATAIQTNLAAVGIKASLVSGGAVIFTTSS